MPVSLCLAMLCFTSCEEDPPVASFTASKKSGEAPLTVNFTSTSAGTITSFAWKFGDGTVSTSMNPSYTYQNAGTYTASLTVAGPGGTDEATEIITVSDPPPVASFTVNTTYGDAPLSVSFTSTSTGTITSYSWNFGDGGSSSSTNPTHTYNSAGTYTARLTVTGPGGSSSDSKTITVEESGTNLIFNNPTHTPITITINSVTKEIDVGGSVEYSGIEGSSVDYSAYAHGETTSGTQVGLEMTWSNTLTLSGGTQSYNLNVGDDYFFIYMTNNSAHILENLYVNYGLSSQTVDYIVVSNTGIKYSVGYYRAWTNSNVRIYLQDQPGYYYYWDYGSHFTLPWEVNQSVSLTVSSRKSAASGIGENPPEMIPGHGEWLNPFVIDHTKPPAMAPSAPGAVDLYCR